MGLFDKFKKKKVQDEQPEQENKSSGSFLGFALLSDNSWDKAGIVRYLKEEWGLSIDENGEGDEESLIFFDGSIMASLALMPAPIPGNEAEQNAAHNYMWPQAVEAAKSHNAHIMAAVMGSEPDNIKKAELFVKLMCACCRQENILGIYTSGTVFEPAFYEDAAELLKDGETIGFSEDDKHSITRSEGVSLPGMTLKISY